MKGQNQFLRELLLYLKIHYKFENMKVLDVQVQAASLNLPKAQAGGESRNYSCRRPNSMFRNFKAVTKCRGV